MTILLKIITIPAVLAIIALIAHSPNTSDIDRTPWEEAWHNNRIIVFIKHGTVLILFIFFCRYKACNKDTLGIFPDKQEMLMPTNTRCSKCFEITEDKIEMQEYMCNECFKQSK